MVRYMSRQSELMRHITELRQMLNEIQDIKVKEKMKKSIDELEQKVTNNKEKIPSEKVLNILKYGERTGLAVIMEDGKKRLCIVEISDNNIYLKKKIILKEKMKVGELMKIGRKIYVSPNKIPTGLIPILETLKAEEIDIL